MGAPAFAAVPAVSCSVSASMSQVAGRRSMLSIIVHGLRVGQVARQAMLAAGVAWPLLSFLRHVPC